MTLGSPKTVYGIHSITLLRRVDKVPLGIVKVMAGAELAVSGSFNDLFGGSSRYPYDSEAGVLDTSMNFTVKEFHNMLLTQALGASVTEVAAEASGNVGTLTNQKGAFVGASTGIASVAASTPADLKSGMYVCVVTGAKVFDVYAVSDIDFVKGTAGSYLDNALKIGTITMGDTSDTQALTGYGFTFTGGSGTVALVTGDTAFFYVRRQNSGVDLITVGQSAQDFPEFSAMIYAQRKANGDMLEIYAPKVKALGLPLSLQEQAWATSQVQAKLLYDADEDCVYKIRRVFAA